MVTTDTFQLHATNVAVDTETSLLTITGFDLGELLAEFSPEEILAKLDPVDIADFYLEGRQD